MFIICMIKVWNFTTKRKIYLTYKSKELRDYEHKRDRKKCNRFLKFISSLNIFFLKFVG